MDDTVERDLGVVLTGHHVHRCVLERVGVRGGVLANRHDEAGPPGILVEDLDGTGHQRTWIIGERRTGHGDREARLDTVSSVEEDRVRVTEVRSGHLVDENDRLAADKGVHPARGLAGGGVAVAPDLGRGLLQEGIGRVGVVPVFPVVVEHQRPRRTDRNRDRVVDVLAGRNAVDRVERLLEFVLRERHEVLLRNARERRGLRNGNALER